MGFYPIVLDLTGRCCLVVGGGPVAERKVEALLEAGARVTIVSPRVTARLEMHARARRLCLLTRCYRRRDLAGQALVFLATDDRIVNATVVRHARARGIWVNAADDPTHCDFTLPSVLTRDQLTVAVSTGGASPALARAIREELESYFSEDYAVLTRVAAEARREARRAAIVASPDAWRRALAGDTRRLIAAGRIDEARQTLVDRLRETPCA